MVADRPTLHAHNQRPSAAVPVRARPGANEARESQERGSRESREQKRGKKGSAHRTGGRWRTARNGDLQRRINGRGESTAATDRTTSVFGEAAGSSQQRAREGGQRSGVGMHGVGEGERGWCERRVLGEVRGSKVAVRSAETDWCLVCALLCRWWASPSIRRRAVVFLRSAMVFC